MQGVVQAKLDGISGRVTYLDGELLELVTRGDGIQGDNITIHAPFIRGIPRTILENVGLVHIRGEIVLPLEDFRKTWQPRGKANPRNTTSGLCKGRSDPADLATLQFVALEYFGSQRNTLGSESAAISLLEKWGFTVPAFNRLVSSFEETENAYNDYLEARSSLPYETDGVVIKIDCYGDQSSFPGVGNRPGHAVALKPPAVRAQTRVTGVEWSMGLSGKFSPVATLEPTPMGGVTLCNVNLFNLDYIRAWHKQGFGVGALVEVLRSGDVIPYLSRVVEPVAGF